MIKYFTYILECVDKSYYTGSTSDLNKRLESHNKGNVKSTKHKLPIKLIYSESYNSLRKANQREFQIKKWKSRKAIERLILNKSSIE